MITYAQEICKCLGWFIQGGMVANAVGIFGRTHHKCIPMNHTCTLCNACPDMHLSWVVQGRGWRGRNRTKQFDRDCLMMHSAALHCRLHDALPCAHCALCILHIVHIVHYKALQCIAPGCILLIIIRLFVAAVHCLQVRGTLETEQKEGSLRAIGEVDMKLRPLNWEDALTLKIRGREGEWMGR